MDWVNFLQFSELLYTLQKGSSSWHCPCRVGWSDLINSRQKNVLCKCLVALLLPCSWWTVCFLAVDRWEDRMELQKGGWWVGLDSKDWRTELVEGQHISRKVAGSYWESVICAVLGFCWWMKRHTDLKKRVGNVILQEPHCRSVMWCALLSTVPTDFLPEQWFWALRQSTCQKKLRKLQNYFGRS